MKTYKLDLGINNNESTELTYLEDEDMFRLNIWRGVDGQPVVITREQLNDLINGFTELYITAKVTV